MQISRLNFVKNAGAFDGGIAGVIWRILVLAVLLAAVATTRICLAETLFVSPRGNDKWSGKLAEPAQNDGPFATVARARDAIRQIREKQPTGINIRVVLRGGSFFLDNPIELGPQDSGTAESPIVYAAAEGERVIISGGQRIDTGRWGEVNGRKAWVMDIPDVKGGGWNFRQLFVNGIRRPRTRLPREGTYVIESLPGYTGDFLRSPTKQFAYAPGQISADWHRLRDVDIVAITRWQDNRMQIAGVDAGHRLVTLDRHSLFALVASATSGDGTARPSVYWVENVREALSVPGQWYLDRADGQLACLPQQGEDIASAEIIAPRLSSVLRIAGHEGSSVHDVKFEGITFSHTEWTPPGDYASSLQAGVEVPGALFFDYAERCAITDCKIEHIGNCGIEVNVGCANLEFARNRMTDLGAGGIRIGHFFSWETDGSGQLTERGRRRKEAMPTGPRSRNITVADNEISHCGQITHGAAGIFVGDNPQNQIVHNHIHHLYYTGISVGSVQTFGATQASGNVIERNHIHDVGQGMLSDLAGIYTCSAPDSRIAHNLVHDVARREYGGWGIYPDEGSHKLLITKNLVYRCQDGAFFAHHNKDITVENNIFALSRAAQIERGGVGGFELAFKRNIVWYADGLAVGHYGNGRIGTDVCAFDSNIYWNASGKPIVFGNKSLSEWQAAGQDTKSVFADPQFVDPERGDFNLRPDSPAAKIRFEPWDFATVGPRPRKQ